MITIIVLNKYKYKIVIKNIIILKKNIIKKLSKLNIDK